MKWVMVALWLMVAAGALAVVLSRDPRRQAIVTGFYGMLLTLTFLLLEAPDVALSQLVVGTLATPGLLLLALSRLRRRSR